MSKDVHEANNFSDEDALKFFKELLEDVFPNGKTERLLDFYSKDVIGHHYFDDEQFNFDDICNRVQAYKTNMKKCNITITKVIVMDAMVIVCSRQTWLNNSDGGLYDQLTHGVCRIKNKKIVEIWHASEVATSTYKEVNKDFTKHMHPFELGQRFRRCFLRTIDAIQSINHEFSRLSTIEIECLFYYFNGFSAKEAALELELSPRTVEEHLSNIRAKFNCSNKRELRKKLFPEVKRCFKHNLLHTNTNPKLDKKLDERPLSTKVRHFFIRSS